MSLFERYLTVWVALCIVAGRHPRPSGAKRISCDRRGRNRQGQSAGRGLDLAHDHSHADQDRLCRARRSPSALARHRRDPLHQLGRQAVLDGGARRVLHRLSVPALSASRSDQLLHRRPDHPRRRAVHGDGVRLVEPDQGRTAFHAHAGRAERHHHGVRLRADRRPAARPLRDFRSVEYAGALGRPLHRRAGDRGATRASARAGDRRDRRRSRACLRRCNPYRWSPCWRRWCCCSVSRASRSSRSRSSF